MTPIRCAYPDLVVIGSDGRCMSTICPSRDDCDGVSDEEVERHIPPSPDQLALFDEFDHRINALERSLSELRRALALWTGSTEGADRGPD
mgnify:CR=1 FL=1